MVTGSIPGYFLVKRFLLAGKTIISIPNNLVVVRGTVMKQRSLRTKRDQMLTIEFHYVVLV